MPEDAEILHRIAKAPERRIFYIDVGPISPDRVAQHIARVKQEIMARQVGLATGRPLTAPVVRRGFLDLFRPPSLRSLMERPLRLARETLTPLLEAERGHYDQHTFMDDHGPNECRVCGTGRSSADNFACRPMTRVERT